jgi:hypothetical protein
MRRSLLSARGLGVFKARKFKRKEVDPQVPHQHHRVERDEVLEERPPRDHFSARELFDPALVQGVGDVRFFDARHQDPLQTCDAFKRSSVSQTSTQKS